MPQKMFGRPGEKAWVWGQYEPEGGGYEITVPKGRKLPPTQKKGIRWVLIQPTETETVRG